MARDNTTPSQSDSARAARFEELEMEIAALEGQLDGQDPQKLIDEHIRNLHRYNEIKDGTQALISKYAVLTNQTVRQVHEELVLPLKD